MKAMAIAAMSALSWVAFVATDADAGISIGGTLTHERVVESGEICDGAIPVVNTGAETEEARIYQTDYRFSCEGQYLYEDPGTNLRSNADWIAFSPHMIEVPPGGAADVSYTIKVPPDEDLVGTYWSILMVEVVAQQPLEAAVTGTGELSLGINQVVRYAVQIVTHIGESGDRRLNFLDTKLLRDAQARILQLDIENTGSRWLRPTISAELYNHEGRLAHSFEGETLRVYPGTSVRYRLDLSGAKPGEYKAVVIADCGGDDVFGATYSVVFQDEDYYAIR